jgi:hypothetical protein
MVVKLAKAYISKAIHGKRELNSIVYETFILRETLEYMCVDLRDGGC